MRRALLLAFLVFFVVPSAARGQTITVALGQVTARLEQVAAIKNKNVAVGEFPLTAGWMSEMSSFLADQLDAALTGHAATSGFKVLARSHLCQVIRENKLWVDDRFDPELHKKLGRLAHADYILAGKVTGLGRQLALTVRLVESETGQQVWADTLTVALDEALRGLLERRLAGDGCGGPGQVASADAEQLSVRISTDKKSYQIGDMIRFGLRVNRDAYVTLVNIGTSGEVAIIYPNRFHPSHFVRGGQDVIVPPPESGFTLTVQGPAGFDQVRAIATVEPVSLHASDFGGRQGTTFRSLDRLQTRDLSVSIKSARDQVAPSKWAEDVIAVEVNR